MNAPNTYIFRLAPVRTKLGDRWGQFGPSVHRIASRVIFRSIDGIGSVQQFGDTYVLSFDNLRGKPAQLEGERLFDEFMVLLSKGTGSDDESSGRKRLADGGEGGRVGRSGFLRRLVRRLKGIFAREDGALAIKLAAEKFDVSENANTDAKPDTATTQLQGRQHNTPVPRPKENAAGRRIASKSVKRPLDDRDNSDAGWKSPLQKDNSLESLKLLREARAIEGAMALTVLRRQNEWSDEMANRDFPPSDLCFIYRSMWNLRSRHLTTYTSVPICWRNSMEVYHGEDVVPPPRRTKDLFELDLLCLENTIEVLCRLLKQKRAVLFMNTVHASTLIDKEMLTEFITLAESIPQAACRQILFEIVDIGEYAFRSDAIQMVKNLSPYARAVTASVSVQDKNFAFWKQCGFMAVGADVSRDQRTEVEIIGNMAHFVTQAKRHKLLSYLRELDKFSLTITAAGSGFDFLEGAAIGSSDDPDNLVLSEFNIENLYNGAPEVVWAD